MRRNEIANYVKLVEGESFSKSLAIFISFEDFSSLMHVENVADNWNLLLEYSLRLSLSFFV